MRIMKIKFLLLTPSSYHIYWSLNTFQQSSERYPLWKRVSTIKCNTSIERLPYSRRGAWNLRKFSRPHKCSQHSSILRSSGKTKPRKRKGRRRRRNIKRVVETMIFFFFFVSNMLLIFRFRVCQIFFENEECLHTFFNPIYLEKYSFLSI